MPSRPFACNVVALMSLGHYLLVAFIVLVPMVAIAPIFVRLRRRRKFTYFRLVDEKTGAPIPNAEVYVVVGATTRNWVAEGRVYQGAPAAGGESRVGTLDAQGSFRHVFGASASVILVRGPGIGAGTIGLESVSEYERFPSEPYVCMLRMGTIAPPAKRSPLTYGAAPGEKLKVREGYINLFEKPELNEHYICWATLDEARANNQAGPMARYWKVRGVEAGPGTSGSSVLLAVDHFEPAD